MKEKILERLKKSEDYVSGEEISRELEVSRNAIWKQINSLREDGYKIESVTNKGYKITYMPDVISGNEIQEGLKTYRIGKKIITYKEIDSTNEEIKRQVKKNAVSGLVCIAERQIKGKGRIGREWISENGKGIYASILIRPQISPMEIMSITLISGLAVCNSIRKLTGQEAMIKWPNDVLINNKKVSGILTEMSAQGEVIEYVIIGIGINVNNEEFDEEIREKATSIYKESGKKQSRNKLLQEILYQIESTSIEYLTDCTYNLIEKYKEKCVTLGREVSVKRRDREIKGIAKDITKKGTLIIKTEEGEEIEINSGEVTVQGIY